MAVRRESVELSLSDAGFTTGMAKAAAMTALLNKELGNVDGTSVKADRSTRQLADGGIKRTGTSARQSSDDLNKYTGRLNALVSAAVTIGPALVPVTAGLIPAVTGLAAGFGAAAGAVGVAMLAFHGVGDAMKALDAYGVAPTTANLDKLNAKMGAVGQGGQQFAQTLSELQPALKNLQATAQAGLLPGMATGLEALMPLLPQVEQIVANIATEMGNLAGKAGKGLAGDAEFQAFFHYLETDAAPTLDSFAKAIGNVGAGLAQMTVDFAPVNRDFAAGLLHASESFREWSDGLAQSQGFHEFVTYMETNGPKAVALLESLGSALLGIAQAAAPVGAAVMPVLTALLNVIAAIGKTPLGPVIYTGVAATIAFNKGADAMSKMLARLTGQTAALSAEMKGLAASTAAVDAAAAAGGKTAPRTFGSKVGVAGLLGAAVGVPFAADAINKVFGYNISPADAKNLGQATQMVNEPQYGFHAKALGIPHLLAQSTSLLGATTPYNALKGSLSGADLNLTQMFQNGQGAQAAAEFDKITASAKKYGASVADVRKEFPQYTAAVNQAKTAAHGEAVSENEAAQAAVKQAAALKAATDAALGAFDAETNYRQALKDAAAQAAKNNAGINGSSDAALANRGALSKLASAWNGQSDAVKNNAKRYAEAKQSFADMATGMGVPIAQARRLAKQLLDIPTSVTTNIVADTGQSMSALQSLKSLINGIPRNVHVNVTSSTNANLAEATGINNKRARGGYITGPGTGTSDSIPAYLSNGEYVMRAAAVSRYGTHMFDSLNAMHFAAGGPVRSNTDSVSGQKTYYLPFDSKVPWDKAEKYVKAEKAVDHLTKALDHLTKQSDALTKAQQVAQSNYDSLTSTVSGNLMGGDLFGGSNGNVFGQQYAAGSIGAVNTKLAQQIKDANDTTSLEKSLAGRGLSGDALNALIAQGGVGGLRSFSNASDADLASYQSLYNQRGTAVQTASSTAADVTGVTAQLQQANAALTAIQAAITTTTAQQAKAQTQATKAKSALATKQAQQTGHAVTKALNHQAKRSKNR